MVVHQSASGGTRLLSRDVTTTQIELVERRRAIRASIALAANPHSGEPKPKHANVRVKLCATHDNKPVAEPLHSRVLQWCRQTRKSKKLIGHQHRISTYIPRLVASSTPPVEKAWSSDASTRAIAKCHHENLPGPSNCIVYSIPIPPFCEFCDSPICANPAASNAPWPFSSSLPPTPSADGGGHEECAPEWAAPSQRSRVLLLGTCCAADGARGFHEGVLSYAGGAGTSIQMRCECSCNGQGLCCHVYMQPLLQTARRRRSSLTVPSSVLGWLDSWPCRATNVCFLFAPWNVANA